jgi:hypothetical protein
MRSNNMYRLITLTIACAAALPLVAARTIPLPVSPEAWVGEVQDTGAVLQSEAARLSVVSCRRGKCLSIGQWRAGRYGARYRYAKRLDGVAGAIRGWYRTEGVHPRQAGITVQFYNGEERVGSRTILLNAAPSGAQFEVPVTHAPAAAKSLAISVGLTEQTEGTVLFGGLAFDPAPHEPRFPDGPVNLTRARPPASFAPGKYFRIERQGSTWWLVTPEGKPFYSVGIAPPSFREDAKGREYLAAVRSLGFNSLSAWHDVKAWAALNDKVLSEGGAPLPQFYALQTRTMNAEFDTVMDMRGNAPGQSAAAAAARGGFNHALPDPFDPRWERSLREQVRAIAGPVKEKPYFLAWFADNEREQRDLYRYVWSPNAAAAFRASLERQYRAIATLNKAWGTDFASFDDLAARKTEPRLRAGAMYTDFHAFGREILRRYNDTLLRVIREEDPGRLVFTNRFMLGDIQSLVENLDLYSGFDAIAVNLYPANLTYGLADHERAIMQLIHEKSGKPLLLGEWSVPARDSGLYNNPQRLDWSYPQTVATQRDRANQTARVQADFYNMPFMLGAHFFIWTDFDSSVRQANRGIFKVSGQPWPEMHQALRDVNSGISKALESR